MKGNQSYHRAHAQQNQPAEPPWFADKPGFTLGCLTFGCGSTTKLDEEAL